MKGLPERRLAVRAGAAVFTLDLTQVRDVAGGAGGADPHLAELLAIPVTSRPQATLVLETRTTPVAVAVDAVGGVVDVAPADMLAVPAHVLVREKGLLRALARVPAPGSWRGASLLPTAAGLVRPTPGEGGTTVLALDLEPLALGRLILRWAEARRGEA